MDHHAGAVDVGDLQLSPGQRGELKRISTEEKAVMGPAKARIKELSRELRGELEDADTDQREIDRLVDAITAEEGKIRKARLGALTRTRKVLNDAQRGRVDRRGH